MGIFDKISNLLFEEVPDNANVNNKPAKKGSWTDIFFMDVSDEDKTEKKKRSFLDIFLEDVPEEDDGIKSTFVAGDESSSLLSDIPSQIEQRESELKNLADFFKAVNPKDYPDSGTEYDAYISLIDQLSKLKSLMSSSQNSAIGSINSYQLEADYRKFETDYQAHIDAIKSLCYLSELSTLNDEMQEMFSSHFTAKTEHRIAQTEGYITLISKKSNKFDKKYSSRLYKELVEAEYRLTLLKLMNELKNKREPRRNPFASFSPQKKKVFETYLSRDLRNTNIKYNSIADNKSMYIRYGLVEADFFYRLDSDAEIIAERINKHTIDDFLLNELLENGEGFETLKRFLGFKLNLNRVDSKTAEITARQADSTPRKTASSQSRNTGRKTASSTNYRPSGNRRNFPDFDDDL